MRFSFLPAFLFFNLLAQAQQYVISTVAGGAASPASIAANQASIGDPPRVAVDGAGNLYFGGSHCVFKVDSSGTLTRIAGNGRSGYSGDGGAATAAQVQFPDGIAVDSAGNIYVADTSANVVRVISRHRYHLDLRRTRRRGIHRRRRAGRAGAVERADGAGARCGGQPLYRGFGEQRGAQGFEERRDYDFRR